MEAIVWIPGILACPRTGTNWFFCQTLSKNAMAVIKNSSNASKYRMPPNNLVVRHMDRRITGRDQSGLLLFSPDFKATYYRPVKEHIMLKNSAFEGRIFVAPVLSQMLLPDHLYVVNNILNLTVNFLQDC